MLAEKKEVKKEKDITKDLIHLTHKLTEIAVLSEKMSMTAKCEKPFR